ncbi:hypothetical protein ACS0TY_021468 [Phlomoides rotata]
MATTDNLIRRGIHLNDEDITCQLCKKKGRKHTTPILRVQGIVHHLVQYNKLARSRLGATCQPVYPFPPLCGVFGKRGEDQGGYYNMDWNSLEYLELKK